MLHVLVGENASGKTKKLYSEVEKLPVNQVVSNLPEYVDRTRELNPARVWIYSNTIDREVMATVDSIIIEGVPAAVSEVISGFLRYGDYLMYDEPDGTCPWQWSNFIYEALFSLQHTYRDCWITSHNVTAAWSVDALYYSCDTNHAISREEAIEVLDKV